MKSERVFASIEWLQVVAVALVLLVLTVGKGGLVEGARALSIVIIGCVAAIGFAARCLGGVRLHRWESAWFVVWLTVTAYIALQLLPHLFQARVPEPALNWPPKWPSTANPAATAAYWAMFTTYWVVAYWVAAMARSRLVVLVGTLVAFAAFQAIYGFIAYMRGYETLIGLWEIAHAPPDTSHDVVRGTFTNRNHLAGFLAVCCPLGIGVLLYGAKSSRRIVASEIRIFLLVCFCVAVALAVLNTGSRLGTVSLLAGLCVFYLTLNYGDAGSSSGRQRYWLLVACALALLAAVWFGLGPLLSRYMAMFDADEFGRLESWRVLLKLPASVWLFGIGASSFEDVFKLVQPPEMYKSLVYAHNDWLQFALEFGGVGALLAAAAFGFWIARNRPLVLAPLQAAALGSAAAMALHSLGDFNLQIPGSAVAFWISLGVLVNRDMSNSAFKRRLAKEQSLKPSHSPRASVRLGFFTA